MLAAPAQAEAPLSAIEWLKAPASISVAQPWNALPSDLPGSGATPGTQGGDVSGSTVPVVDVKPLDAPQADAVGLLPQATTGLPTGLWAASRSDDLIDAFAQMPDTPLPAIQALYYTLLLAEADPPSDVGDDTRFLRARLDALRRYGAVEPALALVERAGPEAPGLFDTWMDLALLTGQEDRPCTALARQPDLSASYATRVFCIARAGSGAQAGSGDWATAALVLDTAAATGALTTHEEQLLAFFLNPELVEEAAPLAPPREMTPLIFRLYEAVGAPLPTRNLPREYAVADLRGTMGWRAEIEAAERLARTGALPANRILGLYTERRPAASGGVWDRVRAVQALDAALQAGAPDQVARALPPAWRAMKAHGLGVVFAALYSSPLGRLELPRGEAQARQAAFEIALLGPEGTTPSRFEPPAPGARFWAGVARGTPDATLADTAGARRVAEGFAASALPEAERVKLEEGRLGEAILWSARRLDSFSASQSVSDAITSLRRVGLEDVARRAAVELHVLRGF